MAETDAMELGKRIRELRERRERNIRLYSRMVWPTFALFSVILVVDTLLGDYPQVSVGARVAFGIVNMALFVVSIRNTVNAYRT